MVDSCQKIKTSRITELKRTFPHVHERITISFDQFYLMELDSGFLGFSSIFLKEQFFALRHLKTRNSQWDQIQTVYQIHGDHILSKNRFRKR